MRALILGTCRPPHSRLIALGHDTVLFISKEKASAQDLDEQHARVFVFGADASDEEYIAIAEQLHRLRPFQAICAFNDMWQALANRVAATLGLPCAVPPELLDVVMHKHKMRDRLAAAGVESVAYRVIESRRELEDAVRALAPCILKPLAGEASNGVTRLGSVEDIDTALAWYERCGHRLPALVETFLQGDEYSVEAISERGEHHLLGVTRKLKDERSFVEKGHVLPAPLPAGTDAAIRAHVTRVLDVLGFVSGASHTELILTRDGPRVVETHTRVGGDRIIDLLQLATGVDVYELVARQAIGEPIAARLPDTISYQQAAAVYYACPSLSDDLVLTAIDEQQAVRELPWVDTLHLIKKEGDRAGLVKSSFDRSALVIATGSDADEALDRARAAIDRLGFCYRWQPG